MSTNRPRFSRRLAALCLFASTAFPATAMHPNHPLGRSPERSFQSAPERIDHIDLFSGSLTLTLPIGPFNLSYNSNIWRYRTDDAGKIVATPDRLDTAGLGWHLGWGEVLSPFHPLNRTGRWMYIGEDGGRHLFFQELHRGEDDGDDSVFYSRDNSYLRLTRHSNQKIEIEFPDGDTHQFTASGQGSTYRLRRIWDPYGSEADPDMEVQYTDHGPSGEPRLWTIADRWGRTHRVRLSDAYPFMLLTVTEVDLESFGGQRSVYRFSHDAVAIDTNCKDTSPTTPARISVPLLTGIEQPDGSSYSFKTDRPFYHDVCTAGIGDLSGVIKGMELPTGGSLGWTWQEVEFPPGRNHSPFFTSAGVAERVMADAGSGLFGSWNYKRTGVGVGPNPDDPADDPRMITEVVTPSGDCSRHFFNARYFRTPSRGRGWEQGLPFVYTEQAGGKFLSSQMWTGNDGAGGCAGTKLRSSYLRFRHDRLPGSLATDDEWLNTNRQIEASRVVFHDDGDRWADTERGEFDGLGHFRRTVSTGNLRPSGSAERRTVRTHYSRSTGVYPGSYVPLAPSEPWILGIFDWIESAEPGAFGEQSRRVEYDFDRRTGALVCSRVLATGLARGPHDVATEFVRDGRGQLIDVRRYGGNLQTLDTAEHGCDNLPAQPESWLRHTYERGVRRSSHRLSPSGQPAPFLSYDADLDPSTGLVVASRDPSGVETTFGYDAANRLRSIHPADRASTAITYTNFDPATRAPATISTHNLSGLTVLTESEVVLDGFGRLQRTRRKLPGAVWSEQERTYDDRGRLVAISEPGRPDKRTEFLDLDPFGRPRTIRPADGESHDIRITYTGIRIVKREARIFKPGGEAYVATKNFFDRHGRLREVRERSGAGGASVPTYYAYDVAGRLTRSITVGAEATQRRVFRYDNRGFLLREKHPEKGRQGAGNTYYSEHDSSGRPGRLQDGPRRLAYRYDPWGRLTEVRDLGRNERLVKEFFYDDAPGFGNGKISRARRHNWIDLPWTPGSGEDHVVVENSYSYHGRHGALSQRQLTLDLPQDPITLVTGYELDPLGNLARVDWPGDDDLIYHYDQGLLEQIPGWIDHVAYDAGGAWSEIAHANGVRDVQVLDPDFSGRPRRLSIAGADEAWTTGTLLYDGSGNLRKMGADTFAYDGVSRLVEASVQGIVQTYTYDTFGNLTRLSTRPPGSPRRTLSIPVDPATNRIDGGLADYDGAGHLVRQESAAYTWDAAGRLVASDTDRYLYDAHDERVMTAFGDSSTPHYRITERGPGQRVVAEFRSRDGSFRVKRYVWAGGRLIASLDSDDGARHYHLDHLDSTRRMTDEEGRVVGRHDFLPYGRQISTDDTGELLRFAGHERDESGRDAMRNRHYDVVHGRFLSTDIARGISGAPQSLNRYAYVRGNPLTLVDPEGREPEKAHKPHITEVFRDLIGLKQAAEGLAEVGGGAKLTLWAVDNGRKFWKVSGVSIIAFGVFNALDGGSQAIESLHSHFTGREPLPLDDPRRGLNLEGLFTGQPTVPVEPEPEAQDPQEGNGELDPQATINDEITVSAAAPPGPSPSTEPEVVCSQSGTLCLVIPAGTLPDERRDILDQLDAQESVNDLREGSCAVNPLACAGGGPGEGGGGFCEASQMHCGGDQLF